jgi:hypothetical protein
MNYKSKLDILTKAYTHMFSMSYEEAKAAARIELQEISEEDEADRKELNYVIDADYIYAMGEKYKIVFTSNDIDKVNQYCSEHKDCGVLEQRQGIIYVCENQKL